MIPRYHSGRAGADSVIPELIRYFVIWMSLYGMPNKQIDQLMMSLK